MNKKDTPKLRLTPPTFKVGKWSIRYSARKYRQRAFSLNHPSLNHRWVISRGEYKKELFPYEVMMDEGFAEFLKKVKEYNRGMDLKDIVQEL